MPHLVVNPKAGFLVAHVITEVFSFCLVLSIYLATKLKYSYVQVY